MKSSRKINLFASMACLILLVLFGAPIIIKAQENIELLEERPYEVIYRDLHSRVIQKVSLYRDDEGNDIPKVSKYTEIATGLHYRDEITGELKESKAEIEIINGVAVATRLKDKYIFSANANDPNGVVDILSSDGKRFRSSPLALMYFDPITGKDAIIATIQNSQGEILPPNKIIYRDAFDNLKADVLITVNLSGMEQDVIIKEQLPNPADFDLIPDLLRLEVLTEFFEAPEPEKIVSTYDEISDPTLRRMVASPVIKNENLDFGQLRIGDGKAFINSLEANPIPQFETPVLKTWRVENGRKILFESLDYQSIKQNLQAINGVNNVPDNIQSEPKNYGSWNPSSDLNEYLKHNGFKSIYEFKRTIPKLVSKPRPDQMPILIANTQNYIPQGLIIDYVTLSSTYTNYTFKSGQTYYFSSSCQFWGDIIIEEGVVFKNGSSVATFNGNLDMRTTKYYPLICTTKNDDSVGAEISGSTGNFSPSSYGLYLLGQSGSPHSVSIHDVLCRFAVMGIYSRYVDITLENVQIANCSYGIRTVNYPDQLDYTARNIFISDVNYSMMRLQSTDLVGQHMTFLNGNELFYNQSSTSTCYLTNSAIINITTDTYDGGANNYSNASASGLLQSVGGADGYIVGGGALENAGTSQLDNQTQYLVTNGSMVPPIVMYDQEIDYDFNFLSRNIFDTDIPDIGYHYPVIDYLVKNIEITDATVHFANGVKIGIAADYGFKVNDNSNFISIGKPKNKNVFAFDRCFQVGATNIVNNNGDWITATFYGSPQNRTLQLEYSDFFRYDIDGWLGRYVNGDNNWFSWTDININNSIFNNSGLKLGIKTNDPVDLFNNIFNNTYFNFYYLYGDVEVYNNTFHIGTFRYGYGDTNNAWIVKDNLFYDVYFVDFGNRSINDDYNAYYSTSDIDGGAANDVSLGSLTFNSITPSSTEGRITGNFYLSSGSDLEDAGSRSASSAKLKYHTTLTDQTTESTSTVDIGYHYVAYDTSEGELFDNDDDLLPDYWEFNAFGDLNDSPMTDPDNDGYLNWQELLHGRNPNSSEFEINITKPVENSITP